MKSLLSALIMLVRFVVFLSSLSLRIVVNLMRLLSVVLVLLLIVKVLQLICAVILILSVWIWLKICFVLVFAVLVLVRPLFMLILILINLIVFGFMTNLRHLIIALRHLSEMTPCPNKCFQLKIDRFILDCSKFILEVINSDDFKR